MSELNLSKRQAQVFELVALGKTDKEIAEILKVKYSTVKTIYVALMEKLSIFSDLKGSKKNRIWTSLIYWQQHIEEFKNLKVEELI